MWETCQWLEVIQIHNTNSESPELDFHQEKKISFKILHLIWEARKDKALLSLMEFQVNKQEDLAIKYMY